MAAKPALSRFAEAVHMWSHGFDTADIAEALALPEGTVAGWIANYRDQAHPDPVPA